MDKEKQILEYIRLNPFISQQELSEKVGLSRPAVANYIASLMRKGEIKGRAYILREESMILCIGGANIDRKARTKQNVRLHSSNPVVMSESYGGVARNIAENLQKLGMETAILTCVGDDKEGKSLLEHTNNQGIDISQVWTFPTERTGTYTALLNIDGEMVVSLADMDIYDKLTPLLLEEKWSYIASSNAVFLDTNIPADSIEFLLKRCYEINLPVFIDPVSSTKTSKLPKRLDGVKAILPNREEAEELTGIKILSISDCKEASQAILKLGVESVIITLGEEGVYYASQDDTGHLLPYEVDIVDVTGAGDAFASGVIYGMMNGKPLALSCQFGLAASALTLMTEHSVSPLLLPEKILKFVKEIPL